MSEDEPRKITDPQEISDYLVRMWEDDGLNNWFRFTILIDPRDDRRSAEQLIEKITYSKNALPRYFSGYLRVVWKTDKFFDIELEPERCLDNTVREQIIATDGLAERVYQTLADETINAEKKLEVLRALRTEYIQINCP